MSRNAHILSGHTQVKKQQAGGWNLGAVAIPDNNCKGHNKTSDTPITSSYSNLRPQVRLGLHMG